MSAAAMLLDDPGAYERRLRRPNPYGDGNAAVRIVQATEHVIDDMPSPAPYGPAFDRLAVLSAGGAQDPTELAELVRDDDTAAITTIDDNPTTAVLPVIGAVGDHG